MLETEPSERNIKNNLPNCKVSCTRSDHRFDFMNSRDAMRTDVAMAVASRYFKDSYFENRKRRPQERGRKKRRKGKWNPIDRLWNSANSKNCSLGTLLEQD